MCVCLIFDSRSGKIKTKITGSKWLEKKKRGHKTDEIATNNKQPS